MQNQNERKVIDPVVDQKIIPQKRKSRGIWWLLLAIIIVLLALWFGLHRPASDNASSMPPSATTGQITEQNNTTPPAPVIENSDANALIRLQNYFDHSTNQDSDWIDLENVSFATGSAKLQVSDQQQLDKIAQLLADNPNNQVVIRGFTDSTGTQNINGLLSGQRANALKQWLSDHNVASNRISIEGQGASQAIANNDTASGRDQNRRVALQVKATNQ